MDNSKQPKPQPAPVKLIKARVRPNNRYGSAAAGQVVEVEERELYLVRHCLISLDDEKLEAVEAAKVPNKTNQAREELEGYRKMYRDQHDARKKLEAERALRAAVEAEAEHKKILNIKD